LTEGKKRKYDNNHNNNNNNNKKKVLRGKEEEEEKKNSTGLESLSHLCAPVSDSHLQMYKKTHRERDELPSLHVLQSDGTPLLLTAAARKKIQKKKKKKKS
jgi:hypothetical protein